MKKLATGCAASLLITPVLVAIAFMAMQPELFAAVVWRMFWTFCALCGLVIAVLIILLNHRRSLRERVYRDGALPIMHRRRRIWRADLPFVAALFAFLVGDEFYIDPNRMGAAAWSFSAFGDVREVEPAGGWQLQHEYNLAIEGTNKLRAAFPGQESNNNPFGRDALVPRFPAAKVLQPRVEKAQPLGLPEPDDAHTPSREPLPDVGTALSTYKGPTVFLGQNDDDVALWKPRNDPHLGVWGKSGSGKTTRLGLTVALAQIVQGYRVIVIDPEGGSAWRCLEPWAQIVSPGEPGCTLWDEIMQWYDARWRNVEAKGATENYQLAKPLRPLAIHFDEFARWRKMSKQSGGDVARYAGNVEDCLQEISQRGRKRGCHLTVYGQLPGDLPEAIAGNLVGATFKQNANQGNKVGHWGAHKLHEGEFAFEDQTYYSFQPVASAQSVLAGRPVIDGILSPGACVPSRVPGNVPGPVSAFHPEVDTPVGNDGNGNKWEAFALDWRYQNPSGGPSALARAMCEADGNVKDYTAYKSEAARRLAAVDAGRPAQPATGLDQLRAMGIDPASVALPKGGRLGVDVSYAMGDD